MRATRGSVRRNGAVALIAVWLGGGAALGGQVELDAGEMGDFTAPAVTQCGITLEGSATLQFQTKWAGGTAGVVGHLSDLYVDGGESLTVTYGEPVQDATYFVRQALCAGDGCGVSFLEAFDAGGLPLGPIQSLEGFGTIDVSKRFGSARVKRFVVTTGLGGFMLGAVSFLADEGMPVVVDLTHGVDRVEINQCGVSMSTFYPRTLHFDGTGMGVSGGTSNSLVDSGERVRVVLPTPSLGVRSTPSLVLDGDGDAVPGEAFLEAFGANGGSLGILRTADAYPKLLADAYGVVLISAFEVTAEGADGLQIGSIAYNAAPESHSGVAGVAALLALATVRRVRQATSFGCRRRCVRRLSL